jgi:hypothetical protein
VRFLSGLDVRNNGIWANFDNKGKSEADTSLNYLALDVIRIGADAKETGISRGFALFIVLK